MIAARAIVLLAGLLAPVLGASAATPAPAPAPAAATSPPPIPRAAVADAAAPVRRHLAARRAAVERRPDEAAAWGRYAMALHAHALVEEASIAYAEAARLDPRDARWPAFHAIALQASDPEASLALHDRAIALAPDYAPGYIRRALVRRGLGREAAALDDLETAVRLAPENVSGHVHLGRLRLARGELDAAIRHLERALPERPREPTVLSALARALALRGDRERARALADRARGREPGRVVDDPRFAAVVFEARTLRSFVERAEVMFAEGLRAEALAEIERGLSLGHDRAPLLATLARFRYAMRQPARAIAAADAAIDAGRDDPGLGMVRALALLDLARAEEALATMQAVVTAAPDDVEARRLAARAAAAAGEPTLALEQLRAIPKARRTAADARARGAALTAVGRHEEAIAALEALARVEDDAASWLALGEAQREAGREDAALASYRRAEATTEEPRPGRRVAAMLARRGDHAAAIERLRGLRERFPGDPSVANDLAWRLATAPDPALRDGAEALALLAPLLERTQRRVAPVLDTAAAALAAAGRTAEAAATMREAIALLPADAEPARREAWAARLAAYEAGRAWTEASGGD